MYVPGFYQPIAIAVAGPPKQLNRHCLTWARDTGGSCRKPRDHLSPATPPPSAADAATIPPRATAHAKNLRRFKRFHSILSLSADAKLTFQRIIRRTASDRRPTHGPTVPDQTQAAVTSAPEMQTKSGVRSNLSPDVYRIVLQ